MYIDPIVEKSVSRLPAALRGLFMSYWQEFQSHAHTIKADPELLETLPVVWVVSEYVARSCLRDPQLLENLVESGDLSRAYNSKELAARIGSGFSGIRDEETLRQRLRKIRRREMVRIAWRDIAGWASLDEVMLTLSELAESCTERALAWLYQQCVDKEGKPVGESSNQPVQMVVLGMGKLGGLELNFSSDIDLMFFYPEDGETDGNSGLSNHEFFTRLGQKLIGVLNDITDDGFVFRVDMRLRPNGDSGPLALSFDAAEHYYQTHGREWERYALIKARVVAGDRQAGNELLKSLKPFVYRRYLDYGAIDAIRSLKAGINQELARKGIENNIKLGPGGIREIEFIGQAFQLIRGGREPSLQQGSILAVLAKLGETGTLTSRSVSDLTEAYRFLRRSENRLQMMADKQTHILPDKEVDQLRLALSMGYGQWPDYNAALRHHMQKVHENFSQVFVAPQGETPADSDDSVAAVWMDRLDKKTARDVLEQTGFKTDPESVLYLIRGLREGSNYKTFSKEGRHRMDCLMPLLLSAAGLGSRPELTVSRLVKLLEAIGRRSAYLALMLENPLALSQLVKLCAASPWISDWIASHPLLLDELLNPVDTFSFRSRKDLAEELRNCLADVDENDLERQMEVLREFCNRYVLHVAAADVGPGLPADKVGMQLSLIAEVLIEACLQVALGALEARHGKAACLVEGENQIRSPGFIIVAYGKLGSYELGYGSDVDMIFLYEKCPDGEGETLGDKPLANETFFARLGQRIIHLLTTRTTGGILYETDMRLRPSGQSGPLVTSLPAFIEYQHKRAWTWEQQALVRARPIAGDQALISAFTEARKNILCQPRDPGELASDVIEMRQKMIDARPVHDATKFDVKHDRGGIVDIEFMVQYWVLRWARQYPDLTHYTDNAAILKALAQAGLLDKAKAELMVSAYYHYLSTIYRLKLMQGGSLAGHDALEGYPGKIEAIWTEVFGS